jgi:hypothetical protein
MDNTQRGDVEFRIMPSGDDGWYWEVITDGRRVITRGVADTGTRRMPGSQRRGPQS